MMLVYAFKKIASIRFGRDLSFERERIGGALLMIILLSMGR